MKKGYPSKILAFFLAVSLVLPSFLLFSTQEARAQDAFTPDYVVDHSETGNLFNIGVGPATTIIAGSINKCVGITAAIGGFFTKKAIVLTLKKLLKQADKEAEAAVEEYALVFKETQEVERFYSLPEKSITEFLDEDVTDDEDGGVGGQTDINNLYADLGTFIVELGLNVDWAKLGQEAASGDADLIQITITDELKEKGGIQRLEEAKNKIDDLSKSIGGHLAKIKGIISFANKILKEANIKTTDPDINPDIKESMDSLNKANSIAEGAEINTLKALGIIKGAETTTTTVLETTIDTGLGIALDLVATSVPTIDKVVKKALEKIDTTIIKTSSQINTTTQKQITVENKIEDHLEEQGWKERCMDALAYNLGRLAIRGITVSTVNWINSGFEDKPFYFDPQTFFTDLWKNEVASFSTELISLDETLYPFAKETAKQILVSQQQRFENNARYTLHEAVTGGNVLAYQDDFELGGWGAWEIMLEEQNNPIGFRAMAEREFENRTKGLNPRDNSVWDYWKEEIRMNDGFLSHSLCQSPAQHNGKSKGQLEKEGKYRECVRWETATPGQAIAGQLDLNLGTSMRQAELSDEINEGLAAIFDALISQGLTQGVRFLTKDGGVLDSKKDPNCPSPKKLVNGDCVD